MVFSGVPGVAPANRRLTKNQNRTIVRRAAPYVVAGLGGLVLALVLFVAYLHIVPAHDFDALKAIPLLAPATQ
jgi:hypothetical protein